jgi:lipopolysaccharide export system protein LptC
MLQAVKSEEIRVDQSIAPEIDKKAAYEKAQRNSVRVRFLKRFIPVVSVLGLMTVLGLAFFNPFSRARGLSLGPVSLSGTSVTMENPRLTGFRQDARPYEVTASAARQDIRKPSMVELDGLNAKISMDPTRSARLQAVSGLFDTQKELLELKSDVRLRTDSGYQADMNSATIDFKAGTVISREPVKVGLTNALIEANTLHVTDNGKLIVFEGRVRATFEEGAGATSKSQEMPQAIPGPKAANEVSRP